MSSPSTHKLLNLGLFFIKRSDVFIDLTLRLRADPDARYEYSKLYYSTGFLSKFNEEQTICFKLSLANAHEQIRLLIPEEARKHKWIRLRLDPFVHASGSCQVEAAKLVAEDANEALSRLAYLLALKEWTRAKVVESETEKRAITPHPPESLSLELTAACNLQCSHCSSHGDIVEHRMNNRRLAFDGELLESLGKEVFPFLTLINLVGRGEPSMVPLALWNRFFELCDENKVLVTCVTNGSFVKQRFDAKKISMLDTLTFSIDGMTHDVFTHNRGGADLDDFLNNLNYFQEIRHGLNVLRKPRLGLSWTLKRNNIHQFPDFVRFAIDAKADLLYVRHLLLFRPQDADESLINEPELTNRYLSVGYNLLKGTDIKLDVPPLSLDKAEAALA